MHLNLQSFCARNGFNTYETEITRRLSRYDDIDTEAFYFSLKSQEAQQTDFPVRQIRYPGRMLFLDRQLSFKLRVASFPFRMLEKFTSFNAITGGKPEDVFVFFENGLPTMPIKGKIIVVLHDVLTLHMDAFAGSRAVKDRKRAERILREASRVVTVSEYSKKDIIDSLHADPSKIDVVYNAVDAGKFSRDRSSAEYLRNVKSKYNLPDKYILHFGSCFPQKNIPTLIRAYSMLPDDIKDEYGLVITNPDSNNGWDNVREIAAENGISGNVVFPENIPNEDKAGMYQLASLFAWPSYIEGFGIPILEAQASGVPVVSSNTASMPEVAGDSAVYFDPSDPEGMSEAMRRCLTDELLSEELVAKGYENLKRFSWDKSAQKFHDIIVSL